MRLYQEINCIIELAILRPGRIFFTVYDQKRFPDEEWWEVLCQLNPMFETVSAWNVYWATNSQHLTMTAVSLTLAMSISLFRQEFHCRYQLLPRRWLRGCRQSLQFHKKSMKIDLTCFSQFLFIRAAEPTADNIADAGKRSLNRLVPWSLHLVQYRDIRLFSFLRYSVWWR